MLANCCHWFFKMLSALKGSMKQERNSKAYTTRWEELLLVN